MKIRNKEHQFIGLKELKSLIDDYPNDAQLGAYIRKLYWQSRRATDNNPQGTSDTSVEFTGDLDADMELAHRLLEEEKRFPGTNSKDYTLNPELQYHSKEEFKETIHGYDANGSPVEEEIDTTIAYTTNPHPRTGI